MKKYSYTIVLFWMCLLQVVISRYAEAQTTAPPTVNISLTITPPYSPYYADYAGINANTILLLVQNTTSETKSIKLSGTLEGDNGIKIWTKSNYIPRTPIVLNPFEVKQLNGLSFKDIFDVNSLNVLGINKSELVYASRIPEGNYTLCLKAQDYTTGKTLSADAPLGCTMINISYPEAPVLVSPMNDFDVISTNPQSVVFNWINQSIVPAGTQYRFQLVELPSLTKMDPNQALNAASFPLIDKTVFGNSCVLSPSDPPIKPNTKYAWRVISVDPTGRVVFKNNGVSTAYTFTYGKENTAGLITLTSPIENANYSNVNNIKFQWLDKGSGSSNEKYEIYIEQPRAAASVATSKSKAPKNLYLQTNGLSLDVLKNQQLQAFLSLEGVYKWSIKRLSNGETSETKRFVVKNDKKNDPYTLKLSGSLDYQFLTDYLNKTGEPRVLSDIPLQIIQIKSLIPIYKHSQKIKVVENGVDKIYEKEVDSIPNYLDLSNNPTGQLKLSSVKVLGEAVSDKNGQFSSDVLINPTDYSVSANRYTFNGKEYVEVTGLAVRVNDARFSDPNWFFYPGYQQITSYGLPKTAVSISYYNLQVSFSTKIQKNFRGTLYLLKQKQRLFEGEVQGLKGQTKDVKLVYTSWGGSNIGNIGGNNSVNLGWSYKDKFDNYDVVGSLPIDVSSQTSNSSNSKFNKLVSSISSSDGIYSLYFEPTDVQNSLYFSPVNISRNISKPYAFTSTEFKGIIRMETVELGPKYISMNVRGRYLYKWKGDGSKAIAKPLPAGTKLVLSKGRLSYVAGSAKELELLDETKIATATVGENGEYAFKIGYTDYQDFNKEGFELIVRMENSRYFTAQPYSFSYNKEKDMTLPDLVAEVREFKFTSRLLNSETKETVNQMLVYLCREKGTRPTLAPKDEGDPLRVDYFKKEYVLNGITYEIIAKASTDINGGFTISRLVTPQDVNDDYFIIAEPDNNSDRNFATLKAFNVSNAIRNLTEFQTNRIIPFQFNSLDMIPTYAFNKSFLGGAFKQGVPVSPLDPYITGAVYPYSNAATNTLEGAKVELFDASPALVKTIRETPNPTNLLYIVGLLGKKPTEAQITTSNGRFEFKVPLTAGFMTIIPTAKVIRVSKPGFITRYSLIQDGIPLGKGQRVNLNPYYLQLPKDIVVDVIDGAGNPVAARILVGDDFSWADTKAMGSYTANSNGTVSYKVSREFANLQSPDGEVEFTVIPTNRTKYKTTVIKKKITNSGEYYKFTIQDNAHLVIVNCIDETTGTSLFADLKITNINTAVAIDKFSVGSKKIHTMSFTAAANNFDLRVVPDGNYTIAKTSFYSDESKTTTLTVYVRPARSVHIMASYTTNVARAGVGKVALKYGEYDVQVKGLDESEYLIAPYNGTAGVTLSKLPLTNNLQIAVSKAKYIGEERQIQGRTTDVQLFNLQYVGENFVDNFYKFPISITQLKQVGNKYTVSGYLNPKGTISTNDLALANSNTRLRFDNVVLTQNKVLNQDVYSISNVVFAENELEGKLFNIYSIKVLDAKGLHLLPNGNTASISGNVALDPNSLANGVRTSVDDAQGIAGQLFLNKKDTPYLGTTSIPTSANLYTSASVEINVNAINSNSITLNGYKTGTSSTIKADVLRTFSTGETDLKAQNLLLSNINRYKPYFRLIDDFVLTAQDELILNPTGLKFNGTLNSFLANVKDKNINQQVLVDISDSKLTVSNTKPFKIKLNTWELEFSNWNFTSNGFQGNGFINALGLTIPVSKMKLTYDQIGYGNVEVKSLKLLNAWPVNFNESDVMTSFGFDKGYTKDKGAWSIAILAKNSTSELASLNGLPDLESTDKILIQNINLYDTGDANDTKITLQENHPFVRLNGIANFKPLSIFGASDYVSIKGRLDIDIPNVKGFDAVTYDLKYKIVNNKFNHVHDVAFQNITFDGKGVQIKFSNNASDQKFNAQDGLQLNGVLTDVDKSSEYAVNVVLKKKAGSTDITVRKDKEEYKDIYFTANKTGSYLANSTGGMTLANGVWNNFWFEGNMTGADGIIPNDSKIKFTVKGDVVANSSKIGVENMSAGGMNGLNLTYDFKEKAILGSVTGIQQSTPYADLLMDVDLRISSNGWYIFSNALATNIKYLPFLNKVGAGIIIGNTITSPLQMASLRKHYRNDEVPANFMENFKEIKGIGAVLSADIKLPILPSFNLDLDPVASCKLEYGAYANVYFSSVFNTDPTKISLALGARIGAYVQLGVSASIGLACAGVSLGAESYADLEGYLPTPLSIPNFSGALVFKLNGSAYVGAGVCNNKCQTPCWDAGLFEICSPIPCVKKGLDREMKIRLGAEWVNKEFKFDTELKETN